MTVTPNGLASRQSPCSSKAVSRDSPHLQRVWSRCRRRGASRPQAPPPYLTAPFSLPPASHLLPPVLPFLSHRRAAAVPDAMPRLPAIVLRALADFLPDPPPMRRFPPDPARFGRSSPTAPPQAPARPPLVSFASWATPLARPCTAVGDLTGDPSCRAGPSPPSFFFSFLPSSLHFPLSFSAPNPPWAPSTGSPSCRCIARDPDELDLRPSSKFASVAYPSPYPAS